MTVTGRLIGVGSVVVDVLATVADLPPRGGDVWASRMRMAVGGGFHALAAAARQGVPVVYAGAHGTGPFGDLARAALHAEGIAVRLAPRPDVDTGMVIVLVDGEGERTFVSGRGAETTLGPADLADLAPAAGDVVLVSGYGFDDALADWVVGQPDGVTAAFDPGPLVRAGPLARVRDRLDWVSANAVEATALTGAADPADAARLLGGRAGAVVRMGERGCVLAVAASAPMALPAVPVTTTGTGIDTTGAGDVHTGVFLATLLRGAAAVAAARLANAVAAGWVATGSYGATGGDLPPRDTSVAGVANVDVLYTASAESTGEGRNGHVQSSDGLLELDLAIPPGMGGKGGATNPEQLFAAGYAACFHSALKGVARQEKVTFGASTVAADVGVGPRDAGGYGLTVALHVTIGGLDQAAADKLVAAAHQMCPYSNATRGNIDVAIDTTVT